MRLATNRANRPPSRTFPSTIEVEQKRPSPASRPHVGHCMVTAPFPIVITRPSLRPPARHHKTSGGRLGSHTYGRAVRADLRPVAAEFGRVEPHRDNRVGALRLGLLDHARDALLAAL